MSVRTLYKVAVIAQVLYKLFKLIYPKFFNCDPAKQTAYIHLEFRHQKQTVY